MKLRWIAATLTLWMLVGCAQGSADASLPTVVLGANEGVAPATTLAKPARAGGLVASAMAVPQAQAALSAGLSGRIAEVTVAEGQRVRAGQTMITLDAAAARAQLAQAQAGLDTAQANHELLLAGATEPALRQAQAAVDAAQAVLEGLESQPRAEVVMQAEANWLSAQAALDTLLNGPTANEIESARLTVEAARGALWAAQSNRDAICGSRALAESQCDGAEAQVLIAEAGVGQAELLLTQLQEGATDEAITQAEQAVRAAEAQLALAREPVTEHELDVARAGVESAQAALDALSAAPRPQQLAAAEAQIALAEAQVQAAQSQLAALMLTAPIDGTITDLSAYSGQWLTPGQPLADLADLSTLLIETTDLSELDIPRIAVGGAANVEIEALGLSVAGVVSEIAPLADTLGGDVVYRVTVKLDGQPEGLRAGMSAEVRFE